MWDTPTAMMEFTPTLKRRLAELLVQAADRLEIVNNINKHSVDLSNEGIALSQQLLALTSAITNLATFEIVLVSATRGNQWTK